MIDKNSIAKQNGSISETDLVESFKSLVFVVRRVLREKNENNVHESSHRRCFVRKGVLKNFAKFTGKHLCQSLFLVVVASSKE